MAKKSFPSISQANMYVFSLGNFFCPDKKYFVQADGQGINILGLSLAAQIILGPALSQHYLNSWEIPYLGNELDWVMIIKSKLTLSEIYFNKVKRL